MFIFVDYFVYMYYFYDYCNIFTNLCKQFFYSCGTVYKYVTMNYMEEAYLNPIGTVVLELNKVFNFQKAKRSYSSKGCSRVKRDNAMTFEIKFKS